jgi:hypothetical protein
LQSASRAQPEPPAQTASPVGGAAGEVPERSEGGGGNLEPVTQVPPSLTLRARQEPDPSPLRADGGQDAPRSEDAEDTPSLTLRTRQEPTPNPKPRPNPHKPKSPRGYKTRPKSKSR